MKIQTKRTYDVYAASDGYRILVDRLWPRGIKKEDAHIDEWMKAVAPSTELRQWYHGGLGTFAEFKQKYKAELKENQALEELRALTKKHKHITLLFASRNEEQNHALILKEILEQKE